MVSFKEAAGESFKILASNYKTVKKDGHFGGNFWFAGNSLHTCLDYMIHAPAPDSAYVVRAAHDYYEASSTNRDWWRDDFGWWGRALLLAVRYQDQLGYDALHNPWYSDLVPWVGKCLTTLRDGWQDSAYGPADHAAGTPAKPIKGGVSNVPPSIGYSSDMFGRNSVTNEGYWLLSDNLANWKDFRNRWSADAATEAARIKAWFNQWLPPNGAGLIDGRGLVLERPLGNTNAAAWCWTGDQGLLAAALCASGDKDTASKIASATMKHMTVNGILEEDLPKEVSTFEVDYATGKGICLRGLVELCLLTKDQQLTKFIKDNARAVWGGWDKKQFSYSWTGGPRVLKSPSEKDKPQALCDLVVLTAGQDALNAAMRLAPGEKI